MLVCNNYVSLVPTQILLRRSTTRTFVQSYGELWEVFERKKLFSRSQCIRYFDMLLPFSPKLPHVNGIMPREINNNFIWQNPYRRIAIKIITF